MNRLLRFLPLTFLLFDWVGKVGGQTITITNQANEVLKDIRVVRTNEDGIVYVFTSGGGGGTLKFSAMPEDLRRRFGGNIATNTAHTSGPQPIEEFTNDVDLFLMLNHKTGLSECDTNSYADSSHDKTNNIMKIWVFCLEGDLVRIECFKTIYISHSSSINLKETLAFFIFEEVQINELFDKYLEWDKIASNNHAEPFKKDIAKIRKLSSDEIPWTFEWDGKASVLGVSVRLTPALEGGSFDAEDVLRIREMLKRLPELKQKLAKRIQTQQSQKTLFK